jgi:hypothetical protein
MMSFFYKNDSILRHFRRFFSSFLLLGHDLRQSAICSRSRNVRQNRGLLPRSNSIAASAGVSGVPAAHKSPDPAASAAAAATAATASAANAPAAQCSLFWQIPPKFPYFTPKSAINI